MEVASIPTVFALRAMITHSQIQLSGTASCVMPCWRRIALYCTACAIGEMPALRLGEMQRGVPGGLARIYAVSSDGDMLFDRLCANYVAAKWGFVTSIMNINSFLLNGVNFWGHNDADMLEVGNSGLSTAESRSHFAFWAAMKSPLIMGNRLAALSQDQIDILQNKYLLGFSQDSTHGAPAKPYKWGTNPDWTFNATNPAEYWSGAGTNGTIVLLLNSLGSARNMSAVFKEIPELESASQRRVIDAWSGQDIGCIAGSIDAEVASHDTAVYLVQEAC
jgi:hypothetical protein